MTVTPRELADGHVPGEMYDLLEELLPTLSFITPRIATVYAAVYAELPTIAVPTGLAIPTLLGTLVDVPSKTVEGIAFRYCVAYHATPLSQDDHPDGRVTYLREPLPRVALPSIHYLVAEPRFADLIHDGPAELRACGFRYSLDAWTEDQRRAIFARDLGSIEERPPTVSPENADYFLRAVANLGTYDADGHYYPKWDDQARGETSQQYRDHVRAARSELALQAGHYYLRVVGEDAQAIYRVATRGTRRYLAPHGQTGSVIFELAEELAEERERVFEVYLIDATGSGVRKEPRPTARWRDLLGDDQHASHLVVDPRTLVAAARPANLFQSVHVSEWDWFVEMVVDVFPDRFARLPLVISPDHPQTQAIGTAGVRERFHTPLKELLKTLGTGPITSAAARQTLADLEDDNWLVLAQGVKTSPTTRFVGIDRFYAYERDVVTGFVTCMPIADYIESLVVGQFWGALGDELAPLATILKAVVIVAGVAVGGWAIATGLCPISARKLVATVLTRELRAEIIRDLIKAAMPLVYGVLGLVLATVTRGALAAMASLTGSRALADAEDAVERTQLFLSGFFEGYIALNFEARFRALAAKALPAEARAVVFTHQVYKAVETIRGVLVTLEHELTDEAIGQGLANLQQAAHLIIRGGAKLIGLLQHLDVDTAAPWVALFGEDTEPPSADDWDAASASAFDAIRTELARRAGQVSSASELLDLGDTEEIAAAVAAGTAYVSYLSAAVFPLIVDGLKIAHAKLGWRGLFVALATVWGGANWLAGSRPGATVDQMRAVAGGAWRLFVESLDFFPGTHETAERNGTLFGHVVGSLWVDHSLLGKDSAIISRLESRGLVGKLGSVGVRGTFGGSIVTSILQIVFHRYVERARRLAFLAGHAETALVDVLDTERHAALDAAGLGHLEALRADSDSAATFAGLVGFLKRVREVTTADLQRFARAYDGDLDGLRRDLGSATETAAALGLVSHLSSVATDLLDGLDRLFARFTASNFSWITLLRELGVSIEGDLEHLRQQVRDALAPQTDALHRP